MTNSNTTLVKVKYSVWYKRYVERLDSNTTLVKVKLKKAKEGVIKCGYSNTTLVKVKSPLVSSLYYAFPFKYNSC